MQLIAITGHAASVRVVTDFLRDKFDFVEYNAGTMISIEAFLLAFTEQQKRTVTKEMSKPERKLIGQQLGLRDDQGKKMWAPVGHVYYEDCPGIVYPNPDGAGAKYVRENQGIVWHVQEETCQLNNYFTDVGLESGDKLLITAGASESDVRTGAAIILRGESIFVCEGEPKP